MGKAKKKRRFEDTPTEKDVARVDEIQADLKDELYKDEDKFLYWEDRIFTAPYRWLITKGYIVAKKIYLSMEDLYQAKIYEDYKGNPNFPGDD